MGHTAFRHPEERVGGEVRFLFVGLGTTRKGVLLAVGRLHERLLGKANPIARTVVGQDVQHRFRLLQLYLVDNELRVIRSHKGRWLVPNNLFLLRLSCNCYEGQQGGDDGLFHIVSVLLFPDLLQSYYFFADNGPVGSIFHIL